MTVYGVIGICRQILENTLTFKYKLKGSSFTSLGEM